MLIRDEVGNVVGRRLIQKLCVQIKWREADAARKVAVKEGAQHAAALAQMMEQLDPDELRGRSSVNKPFKVRAPHRNFDEVVTSICFR